jgi:hypothetical protein
MVRIQLFTTEAQRHRVLKKGKSKSKAESTEETEATEETSGAPVGAVVRRLKPSFNLLPESLRYVSDWAK